MLGLIPLEVVSKQSKKDERLFWSSVGLKAPAQMEMTGLTNEYAPSVALKPAELGRRCAMSDCVLNLIGRYDIENMTVWVGINGVLIFDLKQVVCIRNDLVALNTPQHRFRFVFIGVFEVLCGLL